MSGKKYIRDIRREDGFTLIDTSIALLVIAILIAPILYSLNREYHKRKMDRTVENFQIIDQAIQDYYFLYRNYPCPADPTKSPSDTDYGTAVNNCWATDYPPGSTNVSYGAVPFKDLRIDVKTTLDGWGNKIMYAVSSKLTDEPTAGNQPMDSANAALTFTEWVSNRLDPSYIEGSPLTWTQTTVNTGHYALISPGYNGVGAYTADGILVEACPSAGTTAEAENCNLDASFAVYSYRTDSAHIRSDVPGAKYYDDLTWPREEAPGRMWNSASNPSDIFTDDGRVGINRVPDVNAVLDVAGTLKTDDDVISSNICNGDVPDTNGDSVISVDEVDRDTDCFPASLIAGNDPKMECDTGKLMVGIQGSQIICDEPVLSTGGSTSFKCAAGEYMYGINASGALCTSDPWNPP